MVCKKCGKELKNGTLVCSKCGTKVDKSSEKIEVAYDNEVVFVEPPVITESHTFIDEEDFAKKVKEKAKKEKPKKKRSKKKEEVKEGEMDVISLDDENIPIKKSPAIWVFMFFLMFVIGIVLALVVFPNVIVKEEKKTVEEAVDEGVSFSSEQWTSDEFMLDGVLYRLNSNYLNFANHGWTFDLNRYGFTDGYILNKGEKITTNIDLDSKKYKNANVQVGFVNLGNNARDITECQVWSITIDNHTTDTPVNFMLPGGIQSGSVEKEILSAYGPLPDNMIYRAETSGYTTYHYTNDYTQYLDLTVYDEGGLQQISYRHY